MAVSKWQAFHYWVICPFKNTFIRNLHAFPNILSVFGSKLTFIPLSFGHGPPWHAPGVRWPHICPKGQCEFPFELIEQIPVNVSHSRVRTTLIPVQHLATLWKKGRMIMSKTLLHKVCNHPVFIKTTCTHGVKNLKQSKKWKLSISLIEIISLIKMSTYSNVSNNSL